jgi:hypothetical protein
LVSASFTGSFHRPLADHASGRLLGCSQDLRQHFRVFLVENRDYVGPVVDQNVRVVGNCLVNVTVIGLPVFALDCKHRYPGFDEGRRNVVLRGQRIAGAEHGVSATGLEGQGEVGGFGRDMGAAKEAEAVEWPSLGKGVPDLAEDRHFAGGPFDAALASGGE